jgi:hypothetical protein
LLDILRVINLVDAFYYLLKFSRPLTNGVAKLTPWNRFLLEKLPGSQLVKKYPAFYGNTRFITAFTTVRKLSPL